MSSIDFSSPVPDDILLGVADLWQHMVFSEKMGFCAELPRDDLKATVLDSGIGLCIKLMSINHLLSAAHSLHMHSLTHMLTPSLTRSFPSFRWLNTVLIGFEYMSYGRIIAA